MSPTIYGTSDEPHQLQQITNLYMKLYMKLHNQQKPFKFLKARVLAIPPSVSEKTS